MIALMDGLLAFFALLTLVLVSTFVSRWKLRLKYRLPPGPFCWPILGYLPFHDKENGHIILKELAKKYGGIISLYVGSRFVVVIDDFETAKSVYSMEEFLGRDAELLCLSSDYKQTSLSVISGLTWKVMRKFWLNTFRCLSSGDLNYKPVTSVQLNSLMTDLERSKDFRVDQALELAMNNVTFHLSFGKTFDENHNIIRQLGSYDESVLFFVDMNGLGVFYPWTKLVIKFLLKFSKTTRDIAAMEQLIKKEVIEHQQTLDANNPRDFTDIFLLNMQKTNEENYSMSTLVGNLKLLLLTSSETTRNTLVWFLLLMAEYPKVQDRIHKELDNEIGRERSVQLQDKTSLPMLEAAMMETMRYKNLIHLNLPRRVLRDTSLCGYDIPKDTIVFHNMTSHFHNPKYWKEPDRFYPKRFLSPDRKSVQIPEYFIPFSSGKRSCPGEKIAKETLFLYASNLLQKFKVLPPEGGVNFDMKVNFTNGQRHPVVKFVQRE